MQRVGHKAALNNMQGWFPPSYVEADEHDSVMPADSASNFRNLDASQSGENSASFLGSLVSASYEGAKCFPEGILFKKVGGERCPVESLKQFDWAYGPPLGIAVDIEELADQL